MSKGTDQIEKCDKELNRKFDLIILHTTIQRFLYSILLISSVLTLMALLAKNLIAVDIFFSIMILSNLAIRLARLVIVQKMVGIETVIGKLYQEMPILFIVVVWVFTLMNTCVN